MNSEVQTSEKRSTIKLVPALERGTRILDMVAKSSQSLSATQIGQELGLPKSTVHGLCATLVQLNLLVRKPDQTYKLGPHLMRWANAFSYRSDVANEFASIWDEGTRLPGATITLSVLEGTEVVYIAARNSEMTPNFAFRVGMRLPAPFTATGKSFLSYLRDSEVRELFEKDFPAPITDKSVRDVDDLIGELKACRTRGYSVENEQVSAGMQCFAAPVLNSHNRPIAAIAVSFPKEDISFEKEKGIVSDVQDIARKLSLRMGAQV